MYKVCFALDGNCDGVALRVAQVPTRAVQATTYHFVSINGISNTTIFVRLTTQKMYTIIL
jgi:hypothetical protein